MRLPARGSSSRTATWGRSIVTSARSCRRRSLIWQDPIPAVDHPLIDETGYRRAEGEDPRVRPVGLAAGLDGLGVGLDLPRFRQARRRERRAHSPGPQKDWEVNQPAQLATVLQKLEAIQKEFNGSATGGKKVSLADLIVLGGCAAVEKAAKDAGDRREGSLHAGAHGCVAGADRRRHPSRRSNRSLTVSATITRGKQLMSPEEALVDRAQLLKLTAPEMTVLVGGLRVLGANAGRVQARRLHQAAGNADERLLRQPARHEHAVAAGAGDDGVYEGRDRKTNAVKWTGTRVDLIFGSHSQLRALAEVYACADSKEKFVKDFVAAWTKVMNADRFDLA